MEDGILFRRDVTSPKAQVVLAVFGDYLRGSPKHVTKGKVQDFSVFMTALAEVLAENAISVMALPYEALARTPLHQTTVLILLYNEIRDAAQVAVARDPAGQRFRLTWNAFETGRRLSGKSSCMRIYADADCPCVEALPEGVTGTVAFVTDDSGTGINVTGLSDGTETRAPGKFRSRFVDSTTAFNGRDWLCSLRVLAVGGQPHSVIVRARDKAEGLSVHMQNTPADSDLIRHLYTRYVAGRMGELSGICRRFADVAGPGFYAHDLVPCVETGRILLCETGFKFDSAFHRQFADLKNQLPEYHALFDYPGFCRRAAEYFLEETRRILPDFPRAGG